MFGVPIKLRFTWELGVVKKNKKQLKILDAVLHNGFITIFSSKVNKETFWERYKSRTLNVSEKGAHSLELHNESSFNNKKKSHKLRNHRATCSIFHIKPLLQAD